MEGKHLYGEFFFHGHYHNMEFIYRGSSVEYIYIYRIYKWIYHCSKMGFFPCVPMDEFSIGHRMGMNFLWFDSHVYHWMRVKIYDLKKENIEPTHPKLFLFHPLWYTTPGVFWCLEDLDFGREWITSMGYSWGCNRKQKSYYWLFSWLVYIAFFLSVYLGIFV